MLEEVLRMVLEILNSCLSHQLVYCPNLVYTLLYKRNVFENFRSHPAFQDIIQNIDMVSYIIISINQSKIILIFFILHQVVGFFSSRLQRVQDQKGELGVSEVLEVISKGASQWSSDRLRVRVRYFSIYYKIFLFLFKNVCFFILSIQKFPDLKFKYVEEDAPETFFIPYVWSTVCKYGGIHFNSESMKFLSTKINC